MFLSNYDLRECCYECPFTRTTRAGDITLGDFWGLEKTKPHLFDDKGYSFILLNRPNGKRLFSSITDNIIYEEASILETTQPKLQHPTEPDIWRNLFLKSIRKRGLEQTIEQFSKPRPLWKKGIRYFQRRLKRFLSMFVLPSLYKSEIPYASMTLADWYFIITIYLMPTCFIGFLPDALVYVPGFMDYRFLTFLLALLLPFIGTRSGISDF